MPDDRELLTAEPVDTDTDQRPQGYLPVDLSDAERAKLEAWIKNHLSQIETALSEVHGRFAEEVNQFEGLMPGGDYPYPGAFRINVPLTKKKVREIANRLKQAYLDSDPIWAVVSPALGLDVTQKVEKALDHQVDNVLEAADDLSQALFEAVLHGVGAVEPGWVYLEDTVRDVFVGRGFDGKTMESLADLARFEQEYPDWKDNAQTRDLHGRLARGVDVHDELTYRVATVNRPSVTHIPAKDLRLYPHLNSRLDLQRSPLYGYVKTYTRMELEALGEDGTLDSAQFGRVFGTDEETSTPREAMEDYEVLRATIRYQLDGDEEPTRYKVWYDRESGTILRIRGFTWWLNEPDLVLFHTRQEEPGLFKRGIAWDLKDTHTAANVAFSLYLNGADMANAMRWKAKSGSLAEQHLLQRRWSPHLPMPWRTDPGEVEALVTPTSHLGPLVQGFELLRRQSDEDTQTTSLQSGRESPTDPNAPATKTIALLQQTEPNTKEYLRSLHSGFRLLGRWVLWLYYQGQRLGWIDEVPGLPDLPPEQLREMASQLSPRALLFEFDRGTRLQADNMVLGWVSKLAPQAVPAVLRKAISHVNSDWAQEVDTLPLEAPNTLTPGQPASPSGTPPGGGGRLAGLVPSNGAAAAGRNPRAEMAAMVR